MSRRRIVGTVLGATVLGLLIGAAFSGEAIVAVDVWLGASAVTISAVAVRELLRASAIAPTRLAPGWRLPRKGRSAPEPAGVQRAQTLLAASHSSPRFFSRRLRPELSAIANHFLPRRHGFDSTDWERVQVLLGDLSWLIDPAVTGRSPEPDELERFVDIVVGESQASVAS